MSQRTEYHPPPLTATITYSGDERRASTALSQLARQFDQACTTAVDSLQIAAALESGGITDRIARDEYGQPDVFALAEALYHNVPRRLKAANQSRLGERWQTLRELSHGPLFVLPALAYPAISQATGANGLLVGLVLSTAVGWAWGLGVSWLGYRLIGRGFREEAARILLRSALIGVLAVELAALPLAYFLGLSHQTILLATGQMAYQMAVTVLTMYRREGWMFLALLPSAATNGWYLVTGSGADLALYGTLGTLFLVLACAAYSLWKTPRAKSFEPTLTPPDFLGALPFILYGSLSAALVLFGNTRYMFSDPDLSLSILPLILSMGVLEWQVRRFRERSVLLLRRTRRIPEFVAGERAIFSETLAVSLLTVALFSGATLLALYFSGHLTREGATMFAAHLMLAGAFYVNFVLLARGRLNWVLGSFGGAVVLYALACLFVTPALGFLLTTTLLLVVVAYASKTSFGEVAQYR